MRYAPLDRSVPLVTTIADTMTPDECAAIVAHAESLGLETASIAYRDGPRTNLDARDNERVTFEDPALEALLFERLAPRLPRFDGAAALGLSSRLRVYRYRPGQRFAMHRDGLVELEGARSRLTVLVYLNDVERGGETFFAHSSELVAPRRGLALLFQHALLHEARPVLEGRKYVLRTDVLYPVAG